MLLTTGCAALAANAELTANVATKADISLVDGNLQTQLKAFETHINKTVTSTIGNNSNTEGMYVLGAVLMVFMVLSKLAGIWHWKRFHRRQNFNQRNSRN